MKEERIVRVMGVWVLVCSFMVVAPAAGQPLGDASAFEAQVAEQLRLIEQAYLRVDGRSLQPTAVNSDDEAVSFEFTGGELRLELADEEPSGRAWLRYRAGSGELVTLYGADLSVRAIPAGFHVEGLVHDGNGGVSRALDLVINEAYLGAGTSQLRVDGQAAILWGELGTRTYVQLRDLLAQHPEVTTLVFADVPGSVNDEVNMQTGRLIREAALDTYIGADGKAASGGVDLFVAGTRRIVQAGAELGVHTWCCVDGRAAAALPRSHAAHAEQIQYFSEMLGEAGPDFYFYTLSKGSEDDTYAMSPQEIVQWQIATDWVE